jgi:hypothetical protein
MRSHRSGESVVAIATDMLQTLVIIRRPLTTTEEGSMYQQFLDTWTMREVFNVTEDIYLVPGNRFQIVANDDATTFSIVASGGALDKDWNSCTDLTPVGTKPVALDVLQAMNSTDLSRMKYQDACIKFLSTTTEAQCLKGTVILRGVSTAVRIYIDNDSLAERKLILMSVASAHQSGTAHGDNR